MCNFLVEKSFLVLSYIFVFYNIQQIRITDRDGEERGILINSTFSIWEFFFILCIALNPQSGDSSGAILEVPSEALLHPWFFFGFSLVFYTEQIYKEQGKEILTKSTKHKKEALLRAPLYTL
jgi:hypothetical protein